MPRISPHRAGFTLVELLLVLTIMALIVGIYVPKYRVARGRAAYTGCQENLKSLAVALQAYANENSQIFPVSLSSITPNHISAIPICPNSSSDTYSSSYQKYDTPAIFTVYCAGSNHLDAVDDIANQPYYIFGTGLGP